MDAERWRQVTQFYHAALRRPVPERTAFVRDACGGDEALRREVETLLAQEDAPGGVPETPTFDVAAAVIDPSGVSLVGKQIGVYRVLSLLGVGGMGEVYRARDAKLGRDVAIKVLPREFTADPDRLARFEREARTLAALNHQNIAAIYSLETFAGVPALVLELVDGPTLAARLDQCAGRGLPVAEALTIAKQIADALEAAHERGVVHRDLKPANITITPAGVVKVLDFGLAKFAIGDAFSTDVSQLSTRTISGTREGTILGTATYMSPEQARGQAVDKRTDIWAFGCVLYELLTGRPVFPGATISDTVAAILEREPDWQALPAATSAGIRRLLQRCLEKDPKRRLHDIADARIEIDDALAVGATPSAASVPAAAPTRGSQRGVWAVATLVAALGVALALGAVAYLRPVPVETHTYRTSVLPPDGATFAPSSNPSVRFALSPDGQRLAFLATGADQRTRVWVRALSAFTAQPLDGTDDTSGLFWSPDSRYLGFIAQGKLKKIDASGGLPVNLADTSLRGQYGAWNRDDIILFSEGAGPLYRVSASGGAVSAATMLDAARGEDRHTAPFFLPDGRHFLYLALGSTTRGPFDAAAVYVGSLDSKERKQIPGVASNARYAQGHLLFMHDAALMAQPFDVERFELTGDAKPLADGVGRGGNALEAGGFAASQTGILAYQTAKEDLRSQLVWFDRTGKQLATVGDQADQVALELSPDSARVAVSLLDPARNTRDIWIYDAVRGGRTRFTFDPADEIESIWSPDGTRIVFASRRKGLVDLYQKASNGAGPEELMLADNLDKYPSSFSTDGRFISYYNGSASSPGTRNNVWVLPLFGSRKPIGFLQMKYEEKHARFSADGRWVAYTSNESGREEIYVASFPGPGGKWQVSTAGGAFPRWGRAGNEVFYLAPDHKLMTASVNGLAAAFEVTGVRPLFEVRPRTLPYLNHPAPDYDVAADGQRFLVNTAVERSALEPISIVVNWDAGLKN